MVTEGRLRPSLRLSEFGASSGHRLIILRLPKLGGLETEACRRIGRPLETAEQPTPNALGSQPYDTVTADTSR